MSCRMYEKEYPEIEELVMVNVRQIADMGAYVNLLEYDNIEGMILLSELSRRRIRSIQKLIRVGKNEVAVVLRVDDDKGYIDLSKRRVSAEDVAKCEERFNKSKAVHGIMRNVAEKLNIDLLQLNKDITWPLYSKYGHAYDAFRLAITEPDNVFENINIDESIKKELLNKIEHKLTPQPTKFRADIEVTCFSYDGIDAIKEALLEGEAQSTENIIAPPLYVMLTSSIDKNDALQLLDKSIETIQNTLSKYNGNVVVKMKPKAISENDEIELKELLRRVEKENEEISGDDDSD